MKYFIPTLRNTLLFVGIAVASSQFAVAANTSPSGDMSSAPTFDQVDANKDGNISKSEAKKDAVLSKNFTKADVDSDGKLSHSEYDAWSAGNSGSGSTGSTGNTGNTPSAPAAP